MNQRTTATDTHSVDLEVLRLKLEEDGKVIKENRFSDEGHERLFHTLQTNDCREIIASIVDGDDLANVFTLAGDRSHIDILEAFLHHGMNIDIKDQKGWTVLIGASVEGQEECVRFLLDHNATVDVQSNDGRTALMYASNRRHVGIVQMLLAKNANPDLQNNTGMTALMRASSYGHKEVVQLLLNHNPDTELRNNDGKTALDLTRNARIKEMIRNHVPYTSYLLK